MLSDTKLLLLQQLVHNASKEEIIWTEGYLAGFLDAQQPIAIQPASKGTSLKPVVIYGTETGNSKKVASRILTTFKKNKINAKTVDVFQYDIDKLQKETLALFVMSTQGEGEFPQNAVAFYEKLKVSDADLSTLKFAVLALGDSSYPLYCNAGILLDETLERLGAQRILPLLTADVDYADVVASWEIQLQQFFENDGAAAINTNNAAIQPTPIKKNYKGVISHKVILNDRGSSKETWHIEITTADEVAYEPGDALGVFAKNDSVSIQKVINYFSEDPKRIVKIKDREAPIGEWLAERNIKGLSKRLLEQVSDLLGIATLEEKADLLDILEQNQIPENIGIHSLLELLLPIAPRLYSVSSSTEAHDGQVHLTVSVNRFIVGDQIKTGLASQFLADYPVNTELEFYIHKNTNFKLPSEDTDIIMIGPGTGIAPFRSFLSHRDATGAEGKNWLFFGEQHFVLDFYYQTEIQEWIATGVLNRFDPAFSRDQQHKIYVQDRIRENAKEFNRWLERGATLYVCGQKHPMSTDVENTIIEIIASEQNTSIEKAKVFLETLETSGRYQKDVY